MRAYQNELIDQLTIRSRAVVQLRMGGGKTVIALTAAAELLDAGEVQRVLVVSPLRVAQLVWPQEPLRWAELVDLEVAVSSGPKEHRLRALAGGAPIVVTNFEVIARDLDALLAGGFDLIIVDELSRAKDTRGVNYRALFKLAKQAKRVWGLTGTLLTERLLDIYGQVHLVDPELLGPKTAFIKKYFYVTPYAHHPEPRPNALQQVVERVRPLVLTVDEEEYRQQLPPVVETTIRIPLPPEAREQYEQLHNQMILELGDAWIQAESEPGLVQKLHQFVDGFVYDDEGVPQLTHNTKLLRTVDLVESLDTPALVTYSFVSHAHALLDLLRDRFGIDAVRLVGFGVSDKAFKAAVEAWNRGELKALLIHPRSAGHGLNLQAGGRHVVWASQRWSLDERLQTIARLHRNGQTDPVQVWDLLVTGTVDEAIHNRHRGKLKLMEGFLNELERRD